MDDLVERLAGIVGAVAGPDRTPPAPGMDTLLGEGGFRLDSVGLLETVVACEAAFGVDFDPDADFSRETFLSLGSLARVIRGKGGR